MNKIYRLVWNKSLSLWTVVSENARGVTKKRNVTSTADVNTTASFPSNSRKDQQFKPTQTFLALTISSVLFSTGAFAATNTDGGTVSNNRRGDSMAMSPTASQCGRESSEASVNGYGGVAIGCGSTITGTDITLRQQLNNRRGTGTNDYPTGVDRLSGASTAVGRNNQVSNPGGATVIGNSNVSDGDGSFQNVAIGQGNWTSGQGYNTALGIGNDISIGNSNVAIGVNNRASGNTSIAMGRGTWADADYSIAQGNTATVAVGATSGIAMGHSATTKGERGIAIGSSTSTVENYDPDTAANADGTDAIALGTGAKATENQTTAVGRQAQATGANAAAYGNEANANGTSSVAVGDKAKAQGDNDIAMGLNAATASGGSNNIAMGNGVSTGATGQNVAMGSGSTTANAASSEGGAVAIGRDQKATGDGAVALGDPNTANGNGTVALGRNNTAAGDDAGNTAANGAVAIGNENKAIGQGSVALGNASTAAAAGAVALGDTANAQAANGLALGSNAVATNADDVALGAGSQTSTATGTAYRTGTAASNSVVSVGTAGNERRIQNVSAGAADTDAVNVSQLRSVQDGVDQLGQTTADALGGGSTYDPSTGTVSSPTYNINGTDTGNVGDALAELDKGWTLQSNGANSGAVKAGDTVDIGTADGEENLQVAKEGNDIKYSLNRDLKVDSVTAGDTVINNDGMTITGGPSVTKSGIDAAGTTISNVGPGVAGTDAVNVDQLNQASQDLTDKGFGITAQDGTTVQKKLGEAVDVVGADENITTKVQDGKVAIELAKDLNVNSVTAGDTVMNSDGVTIAGGPSVTKSGIDAAGNKVTNVADGDINPDSKDAINGSQLANNAQSVADALGGGSTVNPDGTVSSPTYNINGTDTGNVGDALAELDKGWTLQSNGANSGAVKAGDTVDIGTADGEENLQVAKEGNDIKYSLNRDLKVDSVTAGDTVINNDGMTITGGPSVTKSGIDAAGTTISNVGPGVAGTDAVNVDQLNQASQDLTDKGFGITAQDGTTVQKKLGEAVDVVGADENITTKVQDGKVAIELAKDLNVNSVTAGDTLMNTDGVTIAGGPSVTKSGIDAAGNKVTNVADGDINPDSKDAINGSQLANNAQSVADALGGGSTVNPDGTVSSPTYNINGTDTGNVGDALAELDKGWTLQSNGANSGAVKAGDTVDIGTADGEENLQVTKEGNDIKYSLNRNLNIDSITAGDTVINNDGMSITGGPSITKSGIDAGNKKVTGVDAGTISADSTDAVNGSQINAQGEGVKNIIGGNTAYDANTGTYTNPDFGGTGQDNINDAIAVVGQAATAAKTEVEAGKNMTVDSKTDADGHTIYTVATADDVEFNSVKVGDVNIDGATGKISGVTDGTVAAGSTDAINGSQLHNTAQSTADALGGGSTVNPDGTVSAPNYTVNGNNVNNVGDAITELDKGWTLQSNAANSGAVKAGDTVDIGTADGEENLQVAKEGNDIKYSLNRDLNVDSVTAGDTVINNDGMSIAGGPSITKSGIDAAGSKITGVAAGAVRPDSTEAINGSQLNAQGEGVKNIIGGNTQYDPNTGKYTNPDIGGTGKDNINDAIGAVGAAAKAAKTTVTEGDNMVVTESKNADGSTNYEVATAKDVKFDSVTSTDEEGNETVLTAQGTQVKDGEGNEAEYGAKGVTLKDQDGNGTVLNSTGLGFVDPMGNNIGPSITSKGIDAGNTVITGVAAGRVAADSQDAINGSQLKGVSDSVAKSIGGNTTVNPDGTINTSNIGGTGKDNINDAIGAVGDAAKAAKSTVSDGKNIVVKESKNADGSTDYEVSTSSDLDVDSVTAGGTRVDGDGLHIDGGPSVTQDGIDAGDKKVTGVADGTVAKDSKDAVNGGQLKGVSDSVAGAIGGNTTVNPDGTIKTSNIGGTGKNNVNDAIESVKNDAKAAKTSVSNTDNNLTINKTTKTDGSTDYEVGLADKIKVKQVDADQVNVAGDQGKTSISGGGISITGPKGEQGPSMTTSGINAGGKKVTGVADGAIAKDSQDAVNGSQLHQSYQDVGAALGGGAGYDPAKGWTGPSYEVGGAKHDNVGDALGALDNADKALGDRITNLGDQMQQAFYDTNQRIDDVKKHANAGVAAAMALETAPYISGKYTYAVGAAYHGGENAVGVTLRKTADNGRWSLTTGVAAASQGDPSFRVGLSGVFD